MSPLQYVILHHEGINAPHYDLMFETRPGSELATWHADAWPLVPGASLTRLKEHRRVYLEFEGELTGRRGRVMRVARGDCDLEIGEGAVWTVRLLTGCPPQTHILRPIVGDRWQLDRAPGPTVS